MTALKLKQAIRPLEGKIVLITGASRGLGAGVAKRFASEGAQLVLAARSRKGLEAVDDAIRELGGYEPALVELDVTDGNAIDALGLALQERYGRLDVLVANAGVLGELMPMAQLPPAMWDRVIATNLTANFRLIRSMDPLLRAAPAGRALFVSSDVTEGAFPYWGAYAVSKAGLEMLAGVYAAELTPTKVKVAVIDPGEVRTEMNASAFPGRDPMTIPSPDDHTVTDKFLQAVLE